MIALAWLAFVCAAVPALLYLWNSFLFREPPHLTCPQPGDDASHSPPGFAGGEGWGEGGEPPGRSTPSPPTPLPRLCGGVESRISVLIPARNEELGIAACVESVLASRHVELEVIVLDDHSTDRTADVVREIAAKDARLRLETAPPLPDGWCGKQAACFALSRLAKFDLLTFIDADVRLEPGALARMILFQERNGAALISGFPCQETGTVLEKLLIPLIHWLLLSFLPLWAMRRFRWSAFGAGCGQWFLTTRAAYERVGGHTAIKSSLHDGITLPRAYRRAGYMTDVCDATNLASCRMYHTNRAVWFGLAKNAREGMASNGQIWFWTVVLLCGQVLPPTLIVIGWNDHATQHLAFCSIFAAWIVRSTMSVQFKQSLLGVFFHPFAILLLLAIQWYALARAMLGKPIGWKGRPYPQPSGELSTSVAGCEPSPGD